MGRRNTARQTPYDAPCDESTRARSREAGGIVLTLIVTAATATLLGLAALHALLAGVLR